ILPQPGAPIKRAVVRPKVVSWLVCVGGYHRRGRCVRLTAHRSRGCSCSALQIQIGTFWHASTRHSLLHQLQHQRACTYSLLTCTYSLLMGTQDIPLFCAIGRVVVQWSRRIVTYKTFLAQLRPSKVGRLPHLAATLDRCQSQNVIGRSGAEMEQQGRILDGNLETLGLQATLKMLALSGKTGILHVTSAQERLAIFLDNGHIIDLEEPHIPPPDLVDMFRLLGRITRAQAAEFRQMSGHNPVAGLDYLHQIGVVPPAELQARIEFRVIQAISRAIRWERGRFEFHRDLSALQARSGALRPLNVDHVLLEALRIADEWGRAATLALTRKTVARWMPEFNGDVTKLGLGREEVGVLCLSNGQFPLHAVAYALLVHEPVIAQKMQRLLELELVEMVDAALEAALERSLVNLLAQSQHQLSMEGRMTPEARMLTLVRTMGTCINGLLVHHTTYARALRGRGEVPRAEVMRYLEASFQPLLSTLQREFLRMDEVLRLTGGRFDYSDIE